MTALVQLPTQAWANPVLQLPLRPNAGHRHSLKPAAWLWTSTYTPDEPEPSDWLRWAWSEEYQDRDVPVWLIDVGPAQVFTIEYPDDLRRFMSRAVQLEGSIRFDGRLDDYSVNWTETTRAWGADALRVTQRGHWATRLTSPFSTYTWDCESTAWVNYPPILSVRPLAMATA